jgi:hypothetical protein
MTKLKNRLANLINDLQYDGLDGDAEDDDVNVTSNDSSYHAAFLETSFMSKLKAGGDEGQTKYQRFGHRAEKERLDEFFDIYNVANSPGYGIEAIYQPGLVHRKGSFWIRDSSDGVALMEGGGVVPIEVKSRCSNRTYQRERQNIQAHSRCKLYDTDSNVVFADVFSHMERDDDDGEIGPVNPLLHELIPKADPNNKKKKKGNVTKKYPKFYVVDSPVLDDNGNMMIGRDKALTTNREVGHLSCYLIAHQKGFNSYAVKNRQTFIDEGRKRTRRESI